ncbi:MAG TPA: BamA/TamA family outer membrane protein [Acidobacteriota bacterium]|nr:BamA/TamA family outer membrane protein [Acidobacteriota bacterium]
MSTTRRALRCFGIATALLLAAAAGRATAQTPSTYGKLSADSRTLTWEPEDGATLTGRHDDLGLFPADLAAFRDVFVSGGLVLRRGTVATSDIAVRPPLVGRGTVEIMFAPLAATDYPEEVLWAAGTQAVVAAGDFWPGTIVAFDGEVVVAGEVAGHVIAIGADVTIREAASVRGTVIVIGGILRQRGDGKIYGDIFAPGGHRRPRLTISRAWEFEEEGFAWRPQVSYDRVDGFRGGLEFRLRGSAFQPQVRVAVAYAFASETWQYRLEVRQRLVRDFDLEAAARIYRMTDTDDSSWVGRDENTVFGLVAGSDYRDYFGADGGELAVTYKYRERGVVSLGYRNVDYRWLSASPNLWHLFRRDHDFRDNFSTAPIPDQDSTAFADYISDFEQRTSAVILTFGVEPLETARHAVGFNGTLRAVYEIAGGRLGGDYDYDRVMLEARGWWDTGEWHRLSLRLFYGAGRRDLPPNKLFYLGGAGSLRGYRQKAFVGDEAFLGTVEYRFNYWANDLLDGGVILFLDVGRATTHPKFWQPRKFKTNVGIGLGLGDAVRLDVAKGLDYSDRDIKVTVRLTMAR